MNNNEPINVFYDHFSKNKIEMVSLEIRKGGFHIWS